jgi:threonine/homoserine/homoserine lactone efflux protein
MAMELSFLLRGILVGFAIAAPVGPIGVLCIRRTLIDGKTVGFICGLGAATADAIYGCIAGLGMISISGLLVDHQIWIRFLGGTALCIFGIQSFLAKPPLIKVVTKSGEKMAEAYLSTFFLTLTNPMTIISFGAVFTAVGTSNETGLYGSAVDLILGVFLGSAMWWFLLSGGVGIFRKKMNAKSFRWANILSGLVLVGFGVVVFMTASR